MRWSHALASGSAIWTMWDSLKHRGCPQFPALEGSDPVPYQPVLRISQGPWTSPVAPDTHIWVSELSPWCHLFVLLPTLCKVSIWNRKIIPLVNILREKDPIFTRACCKYRKSESKLNFWTVVCKNKASFSSYWQAEQQLMQSSCRSVAFRLEEFWLIVAGWACDYADHRHFRHPVDHGWTLCACFLPWLTLVICFPQFDFPEKCGNFLPPFTTAPASNIWWVVGICQL